MKKKTEKAEKVVKTVRKNYPEACSNCLGKPEIEDLKLEGFTGTKCVKMINRDSLEGKVTEHCMEVLSYSRNK